MKLLSPQYSAQVAKDTYPLLDGKGCVTTGANIKLCQRKFSRTVPLNPRTNIGDMTTAAAYSKFNAFCAEVSECDYEVASIT